MLLKKIFSDDLLQISILLSLLRVDWLSYIRINPVHYPELQEIILGTTSAYTQTQFHYFHNRFNGYGYIHPKSIDLEWTQRSVFDEIRTLSRWNNRRYGRANRQIAAFLVSNYENSQTPNQNNAHGASSVQSPSVTPAQNNSQISLENNLIEEGAAASGPNFTASELTKEDMDLIDILWRQDIDMGVGREMFDAAQRQAIDKEYEGQLIRTEDKVDEDFVKEEKLDSWSGIDYHVDNETGEFIAYEKPRVASSSTATFVQLPSDSDLELPSELDDITFDDAITVSNRSEITPPPSSLNTPNISESQFENPLVNALQSSNQIQDGLTVSRSNSLEQRWQDLVSILHLNSSSAQGPNNTFLPIIDSRNSSEQPNSFLSALSNSSRQQLSFLPAMDASPPATSFLSELFNNSEPTPYHSTVNFDFDEGFSFQNSTQMNTSDFLSGLLPIDTIYLDDEPLIQDLKPLHSGHSDSCSPTGDSSLTQDLSDSISRSSECSDTSFDGLEGATAMNVDSYGPKLSSGCESGYSGSDVDSFSLDNEDEDIVFVHELNLGTNPKFKYYKDFYSENPLSLEYIRHNHSYYLSVNSSADGRKVTLPNKNVDRRSQQFTRDERRANAMNIPISNDKIINLPIDEFNELLSKYKLSEAQLSLIRDIRRRGKNKMAAQNCRKRKVNSISTLEEHIFQLREHHRSLKEEHQTLLQQTNNYRDKFEELYREVFQSLRDEHGRPLSQTEYSLQQTSTGNFFILPQQKNSSENSESTSKSKKKNSTNKK